MRNTTRDFHDTSYAECDSVDEKLLGRDSEHDGEEGMWMVKLTNVPCVIVMIKSYIGRDLGNDGEEGMTAKIKKWAECDCYNEKLPRAQLRKL